MRDRLIFASQLLFTLIVAAFLVVPAILSIAAGVTVNYFRGISSGVTLQWVFQVWNLYADTILLSRPRGDLRPPRLMSVVYATILTGMESRGWAPPRARVRLAKPRLLWLFLRHGVAA